ncbi:MAG: FG-GAP-like repeat-containing protein [Planctomycetota bacterium]|jgi:hypothetical protein
MSHSSGWWAEVILAGACAAGAGTDLIAAPQSFTEEAIARGLQYEVVQGDWGEQFGCGVAFADLDRDRDPDIVLLGAADGRVGVYENDGAGSFTDRGLESGIAAQPVPSGVVAADYDADGDLDLYLTNFLAPDVLLRNEGGFVFTDVTEAAGMGHAGPGVGCAWGDFDGDGWLDLYVANRNGDEAPGSNLLYRNLGDGTFVEVAASLDVAVPGEASFQPIFFDFDRDSDADLYISTDKAISCFGGFGNHLFENVGGTFVDITDASGTAACIDGMGIAVGDFDGNGRADLYVTNIPMGNPLFMSQGGGVFSEQSADAGVQSFANGWGTCFLDVDHDGHLDLLVGNDLAPNRLYRGGPWPCPEVAPAMGLDDPGETFCLATADIDDDGDLDVLVQNRLEPVRLYVNGLDGAGHWAKIRVVGPPTNIDAIGALVDVRTGDTWQVREVLAGSSYKSQDDLPVHVGLGAATAMDELRVTWPGGATRTLYGLDVDRTWSVHPPGGGGDANGDGRVDVDDLTAVILAWGSCTAPGPACNADLTGDGAIDVDDLLAVILYWGS